MTPVLQKGDRFKYQSVVERYHLRAEYPDALFEHLHSFTDAQSLVLDIGCGPGKLSYPVARTVRRVDAVDLSEPMIQAARRVPESDEHIRWITGDIHTAELDSNYDLMMAGSSIHWMDLDKLFEYLLPLQSKQGKIVFLDGDAAFNPAWGAEELEILKLLQLEINETRPPWVDSVVYPQPERQVVVTHPLFKPEGTITPMHAVTQSVDDYIEVYFSRQSCALDCMSTDAADRFRARMKELLGNYATDEMLTFEVRLCCQWGRLSR